MFRTIADIFRPSMKAEPTPPTVDEEIKKYADSLAKKRQIAIDRLGEKWILHPKHHVKNQNMPANTLGFK